MTPLWDWTPHFRQGANEDKQSTEFIAEALRGFGFLGRKKKAIVNGAKPKVSTTIIKTPTKVN